MIMKDFIVLAAISARTQAYIQTMAKAGQYPAFCLILAEDQGTCRIERKTSLKEDKYFQSNANLLDVLEQNHIKYQIMGTTDANSDEVYEALINLPQEYVIYSGYGGCILKPRLFGIGKRFIHVHAGRLPQYRGSTTAYYSILNENQIGATGIIMNEKIDEGDIILSAMFPLPCPDINIDYIYEPWVRAQVLIRILDQYLSVGTMVSEDQSEDEAETYFIIHPVLKHIAMLSLEGGI